MDKRLRRLKRLAAGGDEAKNQYIRALEQALFGGSVSEDAHIYITLHDEGTTREIRADHLEIPDMWHLIQVVRSLPDFGDMAEELDEVYVTGDDGQILASIATVLRDIDGFGGNTIADRFNEVWALAHDLRRHVRENG